MLTEIWDFITTPASPWARKNGFLYYSVAMAHRARRCSVHWGSHLTNCHTVFGNFLQQNSQAETLTIFGSGLLIETPLHLIPSSIKEVNLVDVVHTKDVRRSVQKILAGGDFKTQIHWHEIDLLNQEVTVKSDLVVSANLLSQLPLRGALTTGLTAYEIQAQHWERLRQSAPARLLFSDYQMNVLDVNGDTIERRATVDYPVDWQGRWTWNLAPAPEIAKDISVTLDMGMYQETN